MKTKFTLIELIVVIAVLGILVAIILPNISNIQGEAFKTAVVSDARNLQTAVDMYKLEHNNANPTQINPTDEAPQVLLFSELYPKYVTSLPKRQDVLYWLDSKGNVIASSIDAPTEVNYDDGTNLSFNSVEEADSYNIYTNDTHAATGSVGQANALKFVKNVRANTDAKMQLSVSELETGKSYFVSTIDHYGLESAIVGKGYTGAGIPFDNYSLYFDGHGDYIDVGDLEMTKAFSVSLWIDPDDNVNPWMRIMQRANGDGKGFVLGYHEGMVHFQADHYSTQYVAESTVLDPTKWHYVVATYDGKHAPQLYVDGVLQIGYHDDYDYTYFEDGGKHFHISKKVDEDLRYFEGRIDEVSIWNKALTSKEVKQYQKTALQGFEKGLVHYFKFNEGNGSNVTDSVGGVHGTIYDAIWQSR